MKRFFLVFFVVLTCLTLTIGLFACDKEQGGGTDNDGLVDDGFGNMRPSECWLSDCVFSGTEPYYRYLYEWFGTQGEVGVLSEYAVERGKDLISPHGTHYLVCPFYGTVSGTPDFDVYLQFVLVNGVDVLYDTDCVNVSKVSLFVGEYEQRLNFDMGNNPGARITLKASNFYSEQICGMLVVKFNTKTDMTGTLYGSLSVDSSSASSQNHKVGSVATAFVGDQPSTQTEVTVNSFSVGYVADWAYDNGSFSDQYIVDEADFDGGSKCYMVLDFEIQSNRDAEKAEYVYLLAYVPEADVLSATIDEAPTGDIYEHVFNNARHIFAKYKIPDKAGDVKSVRMVLCLTSVGEGIANVGVLVTGDGGVKIAGNSFVRAKLTAGTPDLKYTKGDDGTYYIVSDLWEHNATDIVIPDTYLGLPVTQISKGLFSDHARLQTIVIGNNVTKLDELAFSGCSALTTVKLGSGIKTLPKKAFFDCSALKTVTITADEVQLVGESCFEGCTSLAEISGIESAAGIGSRAFYDCSSLVRLDFVGVADIGSYAFCGCSSLEGVGNITAKLIANYAFSGCAKLASVACPNATKIGDSAFSGCTALVSFDFSAVTGSIGEYAFSGCTSLTSIDLAESYVLLYEYAFAGTSGVRTLNLGGAYFNRPQWLYDYFDLTSVESITVSEKSEFKVDGNCVLSSSNGEYVIVKLGCKNSVIPQNAKYIYQGAFYGCVGLTEITIPSSVEKIEKDAFNGCTGLKTVCMSDGVQVDETAFANCGNYKIVRP